MNIVLLQQNYTVGDVEGNGRKIVEAVLDAVSKKIGPSLFITSELSLIGYPPKDLLFNPEILTICDSQIERISQVLPSESLVVVGTVEKNNSGRGKPFFNSAKVISNRGVVHTSRKTLLPTYDVFEEARYFEPYPFNEPFICNIDGETLRIGFTICEDIWNNQNNLLYEYDPIQALSNSRIDILVNLSASPFCAGKHETRVNLLHEISIKYKIPVVYVNQVGGNDDLVFDGGSFAVDGYLETRERRFCEASILFNTHGSLLAHRHYPSDTLVEIWNALVLGTRDYVHKCGFKKVVLGLSGGIDSAVTAAIAVDALGPENVLGVTMPSEYSSPGSIEDSIQLSKNLGIKLKQIPIQYIVDSYKKHVFIDDSPIIKGLAEENIQARIRGDVLMSISNSLGYLLVTTGNKSELSVGFCTIYGDMCGGLAVISDVPKLMVFDLAKWRNKHNKQGCVIPENTITKPPSAELSHGQQDSNSLPPYEILDPILYLLVEKHASQQMVVDAGYNAETVDKVITLLKNAEFKRQQAAPGLKVTDTAFGTGWRMPLARS